MASGSIDPLPVVELSQPAPFTVVKATPVGSSMQLTDEYRAIFARFEAANGRFVWTWNWSAAGGGALWYVSKGMNGSAVGWTIAFLVLLAALGLIGGIALCVFTGCVGNWAYYQHWRHRQNDVPSLSKVRERQVITVSPLAAPPLPVVAVKAATEDTAKSQAQPTTDKVNQDAPVSAPAQTARLNICLVGIPETAATIKPLTVSIDGTPAGEALYQNGIVMTFDVVPGPHKIQVKNLWRNHVYDIHVPGDGAFTMTLRYSTITGSFGKKPELARAV